ncbi:hypothetical protein AMECASPLE_035071 [Ameca splendens]|uniref:Secreted protein n=1 Tax=Ameca splendens TaxID=208324 RepID=A0ABV0XKD0_9TELE
MICVHCGYNVLLVMCSVVFMSNLPFGAVTHCSSWVSFNHNTFFHKVLEDFSQSWMLGFGRESFCYTALLLNLDIFATFRTQPALGRNFCSFFSYAVSVLAASRTRFCQVF